MADDTAHSVLRPPPATVGAIGWMRKNLFSSPLNSILTLLAAYVALSVALPIISWAFINADWRGDSREACDSGGACWVFIRVRFGQFIYGFYPEAERWRVNAAFLLIIATAAPLFIESFRPKTLVTVFLFTGIPAIVFALFYGGIGGLLLVETHQWGGLMLTLILAAVGITAALPIGILLALGRRSDMVVIRTLCVTFIEFWRGVPLITVLFMASVMLPLFLPEGVSIDKLLRALIGIVLFQSAYMAEVVRGGLNAIPRGQTEAAQSLGLGYWRMMGLIVLPQALKLVIPGIVNTFIALFKDTTLVLIIGLFDLLAIIQAAFSDARWLGYSHEGYVFAALCFWIFCFSMSRFSQRLERKLATGHKS